MKKYRRPASRVGKSASRPLHKTKAISWLPIDDRVIPHIFSFGRVKGIARIFLQVEMILSVIVVLGSLVLFVLQMVH